MIFINNEIGICVGIIVMLYFIGYEFKQFKSRTYIEYFKSNWNKLDSAFIALYLIFIVVNGINISLC